MSVATILLLAQEAGAESSTAVNLFMPGKGVLFVALVVVVVAVLGSILWARAGHSIVVRKIAGLDAVDEAVGRATEMGRPILFVPGIQDMDNIQTVAGITILSKVAKTAAEYDAEIEVPNTRSLVMTSAREAVHAAYLSAGRTDSYNPDRIYYVSDEQFAFVAYTSGLMARKRPAACFYFGCFFAESLILAENGNAIGAIQIAGTAETTQLPFFVASAYLSGEPDQLGTLLGQDIIKAVVWVMIAVVTLVATIAAVTESAGVTQFITNLRISMGGG
jgi:hypothetical protein